MNDLSHNELVNLTTKKEKENAVRKARDDSSYNQAKMVGFGAGAYGSAKAIDKYTRKPLKENSILEQKQQVRKELGLLEEAKKYKQLTEQHGKKHKLPLLMKSVTPAMKAMGRAGVITGIGALAINKGTQYFDKDRQGLMDDEYIKGNRDKYLLGAGIGTGLVGLGINLSLGRKVLKGGKSLLEKGTAHSLNSNLEKAKMAKNTKEYAMLRKKIMDDKKTVQEVGKRTGLWNKSTYRNQAMGMGLQDVGSMVAGGTIASKMGDTPYGNRLKEEYNKRQGLPKESSFVLAHLGQNAAYNLLTRTKRGRKMSGEFIANRLAEGATGKTAGGTEIGRALAYQVLPEAETVAREARHIGRKVGSGALDYGKDEKAGISKLIQGDFHGGAKDLSRTQGVTQTVSALRRNNDGTAGMLYELSQKGGKHTNKKAQSMFKSTYQQPILEEVERALKRKGLAERTKKGKDLAPSLKREKIKTHIAHGGVFALDPVTGAWNMGKRYLGGENIPLKLTDNKIARKAKKIFNTGQNATSTLMTTIPNSMAKAKGMIGAEYERPSMFNKIKRTVMHHGLSPAVAQMNEDAYKMGRIGRELSQDAIKSSNKNKQALEHFNKMEDVAKKTVNTSFKDKVNAARKTWGMKKKINNEGIDLSNLVALGSTDATKSNAAAQKLSAKIRKRQQKRLPEIDKMIETKGGDFVLNNMDKGTDKFAKFNEKYKLWTKPGLALGGAAVSAPMAKDMYDRNRTRDHS